MTSPTVSSLPGSPGSPGSPGTPPRRRKLESLLSAADSRIAVFATSKDVNAKVTLLVFGGAADRPQLAVKMPTTDRAAASVEREARTLVALRRLRLGGIDRTLPRFVQTIEQHGRAASVTTALPGVPMSTRYHDWHHTANALRVRRDFALAAEWLADVQGASAGDLQPVQVAGTWAALILQRWPADVHRDWICERLHALQGVLGCLKTPQTVVHGDFWCGNILVDAGRVSGVVDWECGEVSGEPLRDLARFPLAYALYLDRHTPAGRRVPGHRGMRAGLPGGGVLHALDSSTWFGRAVRDFVAAGLERLGVPPGMWRHVLVAGVAEIAATADHPDFARLHLELLRRLLGELPLPVGSATAGDGSP